MVTFVQPDWVEARIADGSHLVVDPRRKMRYLSGHLKNAISVPAPGAFAADGRLKPNEELAAWLASSGVSSERPVIIYDSYDTQFGSMLVWRWNTLAMVMSPTWRSHSTIGSGRDGRCCTDRLWP